MFGQHHDEDQSQGGHGDPSTDPITIDQSMIEPDHHPVMPGGPNPTPPPLPPPINGQSDASAINPNAVSPAGGFPTATSSKTTHYVSSDNDAPTTNATGVTVDETEELVGIKQQALTELFPLIDKLDQNPEERFRTLMMMIQASDNQRLIKEAFKVSHSIDDEKNRAQALLDIVNEVNYFTTPRDQNQD